MNPIKVLEEKNALLGPGLATNYWFGYLKWICAARDGDDDEEGGDDDEDEKYLFCLKKYWNSLHMLKKYWSSFHLEMQVMLKVRLVKLN